MPIFIASFSLSKKIDGLLLVEQCEFSGMQFFEFCQLCLKIGKILVYFDISHHDIFSLFVIRSEYERGGWVV